MPVKALPLDFQWARASAFSLEAMQQRRWEFERIWEELADVVVNPPYPTSIEMQAKREELARAMVERLKCLSLAAA